MEEVSEWEAPALLRAWGGDVMISCASVERGRGQLRGRRDHAPPRRPPTRGARGHPAQRSSISCV